MTALDLRNLRKTTIQLVQTEERGRLIRNLLTHKVGFREEEEFYSKEKAKLKGGKIFDVKKGTVLLAMREKLNDNYKLEFKLGKLKHKLV